MHYCLPPQLSIWGAAIAAPAHRVTPPMSFFHSRLKTFLYCKSVPLSLSFSSSAHVKIASSIVSYVSKWFEDVFVERRILPAGQQSTANVGFRNNLANMCETINKVMSCGVAKIWRWGTKGLGVF